MSIDTFALIIVAEGINNTDIFGIIFLRLLDFLRLLTLLIYNSFDVILNLLEVIQNGLIDHFFSCLPCQRHQKFILIFRRKSRDKFPGFVFYLFLIIMSWSTLQHTSEMLQKDIIPVIQHRGNELRFSEVGKSRQRHPLFPLRSQFIQVTLNLSTEELILDFHVVVIRHLTEEDTLRERLDCTQRQQFLMLEGDID